jgi:predicted dehydrogenase
MAPYVIPSGILAAEGRPGPNDRIGVGYIGAGRRSGQLRDLSADAQIVAMADVDIRRAQGNAAKYGAKAYQDYRRLLQCGDVDAVVVASPDHWHALHSIHAMQAGKDVYVEKPMTLTIREGRLMVRAARKYNRIVQCGSQQRSMAANHFACELVRGGRIGKIQKVIGHNYSSPWECALPAQPLPKELDWDQWCGPAEPVPYHIDVYTARRNPGWMSFRPYSGGEMTGWGAHGLDQLQWALGMDDSGPVEFWTEGPEFDPPAYNEPESCQRGDKLCSSPKVWFRYANGLTVELGNSKPGGAIFIGEKGKIDISRGKFETDPADIAEEFATGLKDGKYKTANHLHNWLKCIKTRERPNADVEIGHRTATVCHLCNIARWTGRKLRWNPADEIFVGDADANKYLDRAQRKGYELADM